MIRAAVRAGLSARRKSLPAWLLYDDAGCALYERITTLPEYYLTRAEAAIFAQQGDDIVSRVRADGPDSPPAQLSFAELGAGTATKTEHLLAAAVRAQGVCTYLACDIAAGSITAAAERITARLPAVEVRLAVGAHADAGPAIARLPGRQVMLYIGSSIGNSTDVEAAALLREMGAFLRSDGLLLLGTDLLKDPVRLQAAYDDATGVTAAFSLNMLVRLNRELRADFALEAFRHVAIWNPETRNVEVSLESLRPQRVHLESLDLNVDFAAGEHIHTEICAKYDLPRIDGLLAEAGFARVVTYYDPEALFGVHLAERTAP